MVKRVIEGLDRHALDEAVGEHFVRIHEYAADGERRDAENELPTEGYTLLNANIGFTFAQQSIYLFLKGTNLLDEDIRQHTSPLKALIPLPGRSLHVGFRLDFE